jgi:catechol 2,3-dioxygenase-like lactoylglutathione lyase family enzyme
VYSQTSSDLPVSQPSLSLDHVVIFVEDLHRATIDFGELGFEVVPGGAHAGGLTHNALVPFADGTYLELLAPTSRWKVAAFRLPGLRRLSRVVFRSSPSLRRVVRRVDAGEGLVDFAMACSPLAAAVAVLADSQRVEGPLPGGRTRPDGKQVAWQVAFPNSPVLPFLIEDTTPRALRVPPGKTHPCGATGIHAVSIATSSFDRTVALYKTLLGREPFETVAPIPRSLAVEFRLGATLLRVLAPMGANPVLRTHLARRGEGLYNLILRADRSSNLDPARAHGAQITLARS